MPELAQLTNDLIPLLLKLLKPIGILVIGWIGVALAASLVERLLRRTNLDNWVASKLLGRQHADNVNVERAVGRGVYFVGMTFLVVAVLESLDLRAVSQPLTGFLDGFFAFLPRLVAAGALMLAAWIVATIVRTVSKKALSATMDRREPIDEAARDGVVQTIPEALYWAVFLVFLPGILNALALHGVLGPVQNMLDKALSALPNLLGAAVIIAVGWFAARIVQRVVTSLLRSVGLDRVVPADDGASTRSPSEMVGMVAHALVLLPVAIAGLNQLGLDAVTKPASDMLGTLLSAIPQLLGAAIILTIAYFAAKFASSLVASLLGGLGFDALPERLGLPAATGPERTPSRITGKLVMVALMLLATVEALKQLGFDSVAAIVTHVVEFGGQVLLGTLILAAGLYLGRIVSDAVGSSQLPASQPLAHVARGAVLALATAMALAEMGLGEEIIQLTFGLTLGAIAVAAALAFGIGGRDTAAKLLERWTNDAPPR